MKITIDKKEYELPALTLDIADKLDALYSAENERAKGKITLREILTKEYEFLNDVMGYEATAEILKCDDVERVDLTKVSLAVIDIVKAYEEPTKKKRFEYDQKEIREQFFNKEYARLEGLIKSGAKND